MEAILPVLRTAIPDDDAVQLAADHSFLDLISRTQKHGTYIILLKVHDNSHHIVVEFQEFTCLCVEQTINTDYSITDLENLSNLLILQFSTDGS